MSLHYHPNVIVFNRDHIRQTNMERPKKDDPLPGGSFDVSDKDFNPIVQQESRMAEESSYKTYRKDLLSGSSGRKSGYAKSEASAESQTFVASDFQTQAHETQTWAPDYSQIRPIEENQPTSIRARSKFICATCQQAFPTTSDHMYACQSLQGPVTADNPRESTC